MGKTCGRRRDHGGQTDRRRHQPPEGTPDSHRRFVLHLLPAG
jgi:hypothetical protein